MDYQCYVTGVTVSAEEYDEILNDRADMDEGDYIRYAELLGFNKPGIIPPACCDASGNIVVSLPVHDQALDRIFLTRPSNEPEILSVI